RRHILRCVSATTISAASATMQPPTAARTTSDHLGVPGRQPLTAVQIKTTAAIAKQARASAMIAAPASTYHFFAEIAEVTRDLNAWNRFAFSGRCAEIF